VRPLPLNFDVDAAEADEMARQLVDAGE